MFIKFRILKHSGAVAPSSFNCATVGTPTNKLFVGVRVDINDETLIDAAPNTITNGTTAAETIDGLDCEFSIENVDYFKIKIPLVSLEDTAIVRLRITEEESKPYDVTFTVYGYDIGENPNVAPPAGLETILRPFDVHLIPFVFTVPVTAQATIQCPKFFDFRAPDGELVLIKATTSTGVVTWKSPTTGAVLGIGPVIKVPYLEEEVEMEMVNGTSGTATFGVQPKLNVIPSTGYVIGNSGCAGCGCVNGESTVTLNIDMPSVQAYLVENAGVYGKFPSLEWTLSLKDVTSGIEEDTDDGSMVINTALPGTVIPIIYNLPDDLLYDRLYQLTYKLYAPTVDGDLLTTQVINLLPCSFSELTKSDCGTYTWTNKGAIADLVLSKMDENGILTITSTTLAIANGGSKVFNLSDGVYTLAVKRDGVVKYSFKLLALCSYINCLVNFTTKLACNDPCESKTDSGCGCSDCGDNLLGDSAVFGILSTSFFYLLNSIYATSYIFDVLTESDKQLFRDLITLQDRLTVYCDGCP
jgi:hypothetical protein